MLENQFYTRLILNVIFGIMFAYALYRMAIFNNQETGPNKHIVLKIIGGMFIALSCFETIIFIYSLINIEFPETMIDPFLGPNTIVRSSDVPLVWGQPTFTQSMVLNNAIGIFTFLSAATYCFLFKSSLSKWYTKIVKFFLGLLLCAFYVNATKFNYFDFWEFVSPVLFILLFAYIIMRKPTTSKNGVAVVDKREDSTIDTQSQSYNDIKTTKTKTIFTNLSKDVIDSTNNSLVGAMENVNIESDEAKNIEGQKDDMNTYPETSTSNVTMYCKHCGKQIEIDSKFCRYCGGNLRSNAKSRQQIYWPKISLQLFQKKKIKRLLKWICIIGVCYLIVIGLVCGIDYYVNSVMPKGKAKEIYNEQLSIMDHANGDALYQVCKRIIEYKDIPESGDYSGDRDNSLFLTNYAWICIEKLANEGNENAQFMLAVKYYGYEYDSLTWNQRNDGSSGSNPNLNYEKAAFWFLQSAEQGNIGAMNNLANLYLDGLGVTKDALKGLYWRRKSAYYGNDIAQLNLGDSFRDGLEDNIHGEVLKQDIDSALYWWRKSAAQGNKIAKERLEKIY
jgi:hypothetical protein